MDQLHEAPCSGIQPSQHQHQQHQQHQQQRQQQQQLLLQKDVQAKNAAASFVARCLCSTIIVFWAHVSRLWRPLWSLSSAKPEPQAHMLAQTASSWIYVSSMPPFRVTKLSRNTPRLRREYKLHRAVEAAFKMMQMDLCQDGFDLDLPFIPGCLSFCSNMSSPSASPCAEPFRCVDGFPSNVSGYFMEYIRPLNQHHAKYLIRRYLTHSAQHRALSSCETKHFLAKVYLGDTKPLSDKWNADLHDRPAYLDHLLAERVEIRYLAASMGATLAILHWICGVDAQGVEFVLGRDNRGHVQFWLIDFADCQEFQKTPAAMMGQLVDAVMQNEPFWPRWINIRGLKELWPRFRAAYLEVSDFILSDDDDNGMRILPRLFMGQLEKLRGTGQPLE